MSSQQQQNRIKPNFLVIGAEKAGTTLLHELLDAHPQISMSKPKEPAFFALESIYARGWNWYTAFFKDAKGRVLGEASPQYTIDVDFPGAAERIARDLPDAKLIYIIRHPVGRLESAWMHYRVGGRSRLKIRIIPPLDRAVREMPGLIDGSLYWRQLSLYRRHFPDHRILVIFLEDMNADPAGALRRCFEFIGVDPNVKIPHVERQSNVSAGRRMDTDFATWLRGIRFLEAIRAASPAPVRKLYQYLLKRKITGRPTWDPQTLRWVEERLRDDARQILAYTGKPADFWDLCKPVDAVASHTLPQG